MTLKELKEKCDIQCSLGHEYDNVVITVQNPGTVGMRAYTNIASFAPGFDFEKGQMRIEPLHKLLPVEVGRDVPMKAYRIHGMRKILKCPKCEEHLRKTDKFCPRCGQKILENAYVDVNFGGK